MPLYHEVIHLLHDKLHILGKITWHHHFLNEAVAYVCGNEHRIEVSDQIFSDASLNIPEEVTDVLYQFKHLWWLISNSGIEPHSILLYALEYSHDFEEMLLMISGLCLDMPIDILE